MDKSKRIEEIQGFLQQVSANNPDIKIGAGDSGPLFTIEDIHPIHFEKDPESGIYQAKEEENSFHYAAELLHYSLFHEKGEDPLDLNDRGYYIWIILDVLYECLEDSLESDLKQRFKKYLTYFADRPNRLFNTEEFAKQEFCVHEDLLKVLTLFHNVNYTCRNQNFVEDMLNTVFDGIPLNFAFPCAKGWAFLLGTADLLKAVWIQHKLLEEKEIADDLGMSPLKKSFFKLSKKGNDKSEFAELKKNPVFRGFVCHFVLWSISYGIEEIPMFFMKSVSELPQDTVKDLLDQITEINELNVQAWIDNMFTTLDNLENDIRAAQTEKKTLSAEVAELQKKKRELKGKIQQKETYGQSEKEQKLQKEIEALQKENLALQVDVEDLQNDLDEQLLKSLGANSIEELAELDNLVFLYGKNGVAADKQMPRLKEAFPDAKFIDSDYDKLNPKDGIVIILTKYIGGHDNYKAAKSAIKRKQMPFIHCEFQNADMIIDRIKGKKGYHV